MKKPDESKNGLTLYTPEEVKAILQQKWTIHLQEKLYRSAFVYIQQLEADNAQLNRCVENMTDKLNAMNDEVAKLQAERDAAVEDIRLASTSYVGTCQTCKHCKNQVDCDEPEACGLCKVEDCPCRTCGEDDRNWEWRGLQKEE